MKKLIENSIFALAFAIMAVLPFAIDGQTPKPAPKPQLPPISDTSLPPAAPPAPVSSKSPVSKKPDRVGDLSDTTERSARVDPAINLEFPCVIEGTIRVNGWNRNEIRVFVKDGSRFSFRTAESNPKSNDPVWIKVVGANSKTKYGPDSDCMAGGHIDVDVPVTATIRIRGREITSKVDSVRRVEIGSIGGDISLRNVTGGISANAGRGDITVDASEGAMSLSTTEGNILVFEVGPSGIGDKFKANTNSGAISLQNVDFRQVDVDSISGSVSYNGNVLSGGSYSMRTSKGSIRMIVPLESSFRLFATYGYGNFVTDIPVKINTENVNGSNSGPIKSVSGTVGKGTSADAIVKLTTANGSVSLRKP